VRLFKLDTADTDRSGKSSEPIDEALGTVYWKLVDPGERLSEWRICTVRHHDGSWHIWSRGEAVLEDPAFEEVHQHALTFFMVGGDPKDFPHQEFDL
jgi:hypothetical protein